MTLLFLCVVDVCVGMLMVSFVFLAVVGIVDVRGRCCCCVCLLLVLAVVVC